MCSSDLGISFDHRMGEETGVGVVDTTRAWVAARDILDLATLWDDVDALTGCVKLDLQLELFLELRSMAERATLWLLRHRKLPLDIGAAVEAYRPGMQALVRLEGSLRGRLREEGFAAEARRLAGGVPEHLAQRSAQWRLLHTCFDMIDLAERTGRPLGEVSTTYWHVFDLMDLAWLWDGVGSLPRSTRWQTQARSALRDDLVAALADLCEDALLAGGVADWQAGNERLVARAQAMFTDLRRVDTHDLTTLSVAVRQLRNLALLT